MVSEVSNQITFHCCQCRNYPLRRCYFTISGCLIFKDVTLLKLYLGTAATFVPIGGAEVNSSIGDLATRPVAANGLSAEFKAVSLADAGTHPARGPLRDSILSFQHTNFTKHSHVGSWHPLPMSWAPPWEILDPPLSMLRGDSGSAKRSDSL